MTNREKIAEILATVGVAERDLDAARRNFECMGQSEIDQKLERLRAGSVRVAQWRARRGRPHEARVLPKAEEREIPAPDTIQQELAALTRMVERLSPDQSPGLLRDIKDKHRLLASELAQASVTARTRFEAFVKNKIDAMDVLAVNVARREIGTLLGHPVIPSHRESLNASDTLDAFGRVANAVSRNRPDLFLAINEGFPIAQLIKNLLRLEAPIAIVRGSASAGLKWPLPDRLSEIPRVVWVVGHVARTGATLVETIQEARRKYRTDDVFGAVLVASTDAVTNFSKFYFHQVMEARTIDLGFDTSKEVRVQGDDFVLGADDDVDPQNLHLNRFMLERARADMLREFLDE